MVKHDPPIDDRNDEGFASRLRDSMAHKMTLIPESQIQEIAETASTKAVIKVWMQFGVNLDDAESVRSINEDFIELRRQRKARERWEWMIKGSIVTALLGIAGVIGSYVLRLISADVHHPH